MKKMLLCVVGLCLAASVCADPFRNLNFDEADPSRVDGFSLRGTTIDLLPGWRVFYGTNELSTIAYDYYDPEGPFRQSDVAVIPGNFFTGVAAGYFLDILDTHNNMPGFTLQQRGDIPQYGQYLIFIFAGAYLNVAIDGQHLPFVRSTGNTTPTSRPETITFDSSQFAGRKNALLTFTTANPPSGTSETYLDNIVFAVPEPSTFALLGLGTGALIWQNFRNVRRTR